MILILMLAACTGDPNDTGPDEVAPLEPAPDGTTYVYQVYDAGGDSQHWPAAFVDGEYQGDAYTEVTLGDFGVAQPEGVRAWIDLGEGSMTEVRIRAIEYWSGTHDEPVFEWLFNPLWTIPLDGSLKDQPQVVAPAGQFVVSGTPQALELSGTYTLTSTNADVDVAYGRVRGCWTWDFDLVEMALQIEGQLSMKSGVGLVQSDWVPGITSAELEEVHKP